MKMKVIKEQQVPYWDNKNEIITEQTILGVYRKKKYKIELKQEIGYFNCKPNDIMVFRTYVNIYKNNEHLKRRLFYGDNGVKWKQYVDEFIS